MSLSCRHLVRSAVCRVLPSPPQEASELTEERPTVIVDSGVGLSQADSTSSPADTAPAAARRRRTAAVTSAAPPRGIEVMAKGYLAPWVTPLRGVWRAPVLRHAWLGGAAVPGRAEQAAGRGEQAQREHDGGQAQPR